MGAIAVMAGVALVPAPSFAASLLEFALDVNSITIQATDAVGNATPFGGETHNGKLVFSKDGDSTIAVGINGVSQAASFNASFLSLNGEVSFLNGVSLGGTMNVKVKNPDTTVDTYSFNISAGDPLTRPLGAIAFSLTGYQFDAETSNGLFNDANYGGVNVAPWFAGQVPSGLNGAFFQLKYVPNAQGFSNQSDVDILTTTAVPLPASAMAGLGLIGLLALARHRRAVALA